MKKLVLIIGIVLCIAVIGSVFAIAVYDATDSTGSIGTDTYLYLTLNSTGSTGCTLEKGKPTIIPIVLGIDSNAADWGTATLTVTPSAQEGKSIDKVAITIWANEACTESIEGLTTAGGVMTLTGITEGSTVYVRLLLADDATEAEVNNAAGVLNVKLVQAA